MNDERTAERTDEADEPESPESTPGGVAGGGSGDPRTTLAGRYEVNLEAEPEDAGIAVAYLGRDLRTRAPVTVKTLRLEYRDDPDTRARFRREARLLQFLSHPNVVRALTFTEERGAPWLILERVAGRSLRDEIDANAPFRPEDVVAALEGIAAALDHLHARGLVHLDLRPENVMVMPDRQVKLIDFGLAQTGGAVPEIPSSGPHPYLAPEQLTGEPVEVTTDVYALGCVVYEMLAGTPPFLPASGAASTEEIVRARLTQAARPPGEGRKAALPPWVDDVVLGALERDPQLRYGSAGLFAGLYRVGVEGETDVETGRPHASRSRPSGRQFPINEPGVAMKGSRRLASRRAETNDEDVDHEQVIDVAFVPAERAVRPARTSARLLPRTSRGKVDLALLERHLWQACAIVLLLNLLLIGALVATRGEVPGIWTPGATVGPGSIVRIAGTGLVARAEPRPDAEIAAELPDGGSVQIDGDVVANDTGLWWPVEIETDQGPVRGYVPQDWVQP